MIAIRRILPALLALTGAAAFGQPLRCVVNAGVPPTVRYEGVTEMVGDVLLNCTGGTPAAPGAPVPKSDVTLYLNTNVTSRVLSTASGTTWIEALLMVDEPHSTYNPTVPLLACGDSGAPDDPANPGVCAINGAAGGNGIYNGATNRPNVWQGRLNGDHTITWPGVPIDAPPVGGTRVIRITNVRVNASQIAAVPGVVDMAITLGGANVIPVVSDPNQPLVDGVPSNAVAYVMPGVEVEVFGAGSFPQDTSHNGDAFNSDSDNRANLTADFLVRFREANFPAFKRKNWAIQAYGASVDQNQNVPDAIYGTESGFENLGPLSEPPVNPPPTIAIGSSRVLATAAFPGYHGMSGAGIAQSGTRLLVNFAQIPAGTEVFIPIFVNAVSRTTGQSTGYAYLVNTGPYGAGDGTPLSSLGSIAACSVNITSAGASCPFSTGLAMIGVFNGAGLGVYEVYSSNTFNLEDLSIPVVLAYAAQPAQHLPVAGIQTTVYPSLGPLSHDGTANASEFVPRFVANTTSAQNLFTIAALQPSYAGYIDNLSCQAISGWAADRNQLGLSIPVSIYDGTTLLTRMTAALLRSDVGTSLNDNGLHGFSYTLAASIRDGSAHTIRAVFDSSTTDLPGSPKTVNCAPKYSGSIDTSSCVAITGWAADRIRPSVPISVSLWNDTGAIYTTTANAPRSDVGTFLGDNGLHGFSVPIPPGYANGLSHTFHVRYESSSTDVGPSVKLTCGTAAPSFAGNVDQASCAGITGWVADRNQLNTPIKVSLWDSGAEIASTTANLSRPDVGTALGDNGVHGFSFALPPGYANGLGHTLEVRYQNSAMQVFGQPVFPTVYGSPFTLTCSPTTNYAGYVDSASCSGITGWVADRNRPNVPIVVSLWDGATQIASTTANTLRSDVGAFLNDNGLHAFRLTLPSAYANGVPHALQVHYESSASVVPNGSANLTCGAGVNYAGWVDTASCSGITGWAADRNRLNTPITVSLWDGATQIASTTASSVRADVGAAVGDNGAHGFSLAIPPAYANGVNHSLQIRYETSASQLPGSPTSLTCGTGPNYTGSVDVLSCSTISGWAADRNALNSSIDINIYDGSTLLSTTPATGSRSDVGTYLGDNGLHGFGVSTPSALKDGRPHTITVRPGSSSNPLYGQQSLTCQP